ncbi:MAG: NUDIX domain-containing protein [Streptosporangiales bacterium]|nr:NUDIX domain-containing protein [Streptosporangiales bacterium]
MAAGALFVDSRDRVLLVEPVYKDVWDIPGGVVEPEESPRAGCRREVREELGLDRPVGGLLGVDWVPTEPPRTEGLMLIFDGGPLAEHETAAIRLPDDELKSWRWVDRDDVRSLASARTASRILACFAARRAGETVYLEAGRP